MLSLVLKIVLAVVQALPAVIETIKSQRAKDRREIRDEAIEKDPIAEFEHKFGKLQSDPTPSKTDTNTSVSASSPKSNSNVSPSDG